MRALASPYPGADLKSMGSAGDAGARGRPRARSSARPVADGAPRRPVGRHRGPADRSLRDRLRAFGRSGGGALAVAGAVLVLGLVGAVFSSTTQNPPNVYTAAQLDAYVPTAVTATRTSSTTCLVSWTPVASPPAGLTYDVTNGSGTTVVTGASGTSATATVPVTAVTPTVKARLGTWVSTASTAAASACLGWPDAPGSLSLTPSDGAVSATWSAPAANGGTLASYTATISPAPSSGSATCTATVPTTSCSWSNLSNGLTYTVSVTATSNVGTGPAATATAIPYPSTVMSPSALKLWLDGADASTMLASSGCTGATATTTVGCWKDKSTSANNAVQATAGSRPALATVSSRSVPDFDGSTSSMSLTPGLLPTGTTSSSTFVAARTTDPSPATSSWKTLLAWGTAAPQQNRAYQKNGTSAAMVAVTWSSVGSSGGSIGTGTTGILSDAWTSAGYTGYWNGVAGSAQAVANTTGSTTATVGAQLDGNYLWQGPIPEVVVVQGTLTTAQRRAVEEYLSRKWSVAVTPGLPTGVAAAAGDGQATVSWTAPYDGGSAITSYTVTAVPSDGSLPTVTQACASSPCTPAGLTNGVTYTVTVTANNAVGAGPASSSVTVVPRPALLASSNAVLWLDGVDVDGDGVLEGTAESCDTATSCTATANLLKRWVDKTGGGRDAVQSSSSLAGTYAPATGQVSFSLAQNGYYQTASGVPTGPDVTAFAVASAAGSTWNTDGWLLGSRTADGWMLHPNAGANNAKFFGITSAGYNQQTALSPDLAPTTAITSPHVWDGRISGGTTTQSIDVAVDGVVSAATASTSARAATNTVLTLGADAYDLTNRRGQGAYREVVVFKTALTAAERRTVRAYLARKWGAAIVPDPPASVTATPSTTSGTASVAWTAPWNGGSAITGYTVTATPSDGTLATVTTSCASSPCTVSGLVDGAAYTVTVTATNAAGTGAATTATTNAGGTLFTYPAGIMTAARMRLWLDGADTTTLYQASSCSGSLAAAANDPVGCWVDKSGQANNATQPLSTAYRPGLTALGSRLVPTFDGTNDWYTLTVSKLPTGSTASSMSFVAKLTAATGYRNILSWGTLTAGTARAQYLDSGPVKADTYTAGPASSQGSVSNGTFFQATTTYSATTTSVSVNAAPATTSAAGSVNTGSSGGFAAMGGAQGMSYYWTGPIPETVVLTGAVTATEQRTIDEYLARKWGTTIVPAAPGSVTATASTTTDGAATVSWTTPSWNGGSAITAYTLTATPADGTAATVTTSCASSPCTMTGLTNGALYTVTVAAVNAAGTGAATTAAATVTPYPAGIFAASSLKLWMDGADASTLFTATTCTGGTAAAGTSIGCWKDKSSQANNAAQTTSTLRPTVSSLNSRTAPAFDGTDDYYPLDVTKLPTGTTASAIYSVAVQEDTAPASSCFRHLIGWGANSNTTGRVVEKGCNDSNVYVETFGTWASVTPTKTWPVSAAAVVDGVITSSSFTSNVNGATNYVGSASNNTGTSSGAALAATGWNTGTNATWKGRLPEMIVLAVNPSAADNRTVQEYLARKWNVAITPSAPSGVTVTGADSQASVAWTAPWNGYSSITGYTVTATPVDGSLPTRTASCASSPCTVASLTNGATYAFTVKATNALGTGPSSTAVNASPYPATLFASADLKVWLDAQYDGALSTATDCSGSGATSGVVGCWKDRSGNGWDAPAASGSAGATLTSGAINGRTALRFSKTTSTMYKVSSAGIGAVGSADRSVFATAVGRTVLGTTGVKYAGVVTSWNTNMQSAVLVKAYNGTTTTADYVQGDAYNSSAAGIYGGASYTASSPFVVSSVQSSSGGTLTNSTRLGGNGLTASSSVAGTWMSYGDSLVLGAADSNLAVDYAYPLDGDIGEVLVFDRALTSAERRTVEEYLARHWGQTIGPSAPTLSTVTKPSSGQLTASWSAPTGWNGGAAVTGYTAVASATGQTSKSCSTASTSCTITGLTAGVTYSVVVAATNTAGAGAASNALTGTA